jgi:lipopolysaccharide/colanic/teichoic acid biosynthesis glycosyltransferase
MDLFVGATLLLLTGIPMILAMFMILASSPGPVFFVQTRVGLGGKPFRILKLRTMTVDPGRVTAQTLNSDPEVLPVGKFLRHFKIDELPQIVNVLKGDMSLVGPRPCLEETRAAMPDWARRRFEVRPGLTGLAQVNGNVSLSWVERWRHDVDYVNRYSLVLDMKIIAKTVVVLLLGENRFRSVI